MKRWKDNWDAVSPIFKFSATVRKVIYTTNEIEITEFHLSEAQLAEKCISKRYLPVKSPVSGTFETMKKWTATIRNWTQVYGELSIMYEGRLPE